MEVVSLKIPFLFCYRCIAKEKRNFLVNYSEQKRIFLRWNLGTLLAEH